MVPRGIVPFAPTRAEPYRLHSVGSRTEAPGPADGGLSFVAGNPYPEAYGLAGSGCLLRDGHEPLVPQRTLPRP